MDKYKFNREQLNFVKSKRSIKDILRIIFKYFVISLVLSLIYYAVFSLIIDTEREKKLERENVAMSKEYERLSNEIEVLDKTIKNLKYRDLEIYKEIFNAVPSTVSSSDNLDVFLEKVDSIKESKILEFTAKNIEDIESEAESINNLINGISSQFETMGDKLLFIPSIVPIKNFSIGQTGASVGEKINPFYKSVVMHEGIDLLGAVGTEILASASGVVELVTRMGKQRGNIVVINHGNGYVTRYMHMGNILVRRGEKVEKGGIIGRIGISGISLAPHLHYEVEFNGKKQDPLNYFFSDLTPLMYKEMLVISTNTGQSLD